MATAGMVGEASHVLEAIEVGNACWATRNGDSTDWDFSDWTTPLEAAQEGWAEHTRESFEWLCADFSDGMGLTYYTDDAFRPEERRGKPEHCILVREPVEGASGIGVPDDEVRLPITRSAENDPVSLMFPLSGVYDIATEGNNCKGVKFTLGRNLSSETFSIDIDSRVRLDFAEDAHYVHVIPAKKAAKKPCAWSVTLIPVVEEADGGSGEGDDEP